MARWNMLELSVVLWLSEFLLYFAGYHSWSVRSDSCIHQVVFNASGLPYTQKLDNLLNANYPLDIRSILHFLIYFLIWFRGTRRYYLHLTMIPSRKHWMNTIEAESTYMGFSSQIFGSGDLSIKTVSITLIWVLSTLKLNACHLFCTGEPKLIMAVRSVRLKTIEWSVPR